MVFKVPQPKPEGKAMQVYLFHGRMTISVEGFLLVRYSLSGIAVSRLVKYRRLVAFIVYLKTTIVAITSTVLQYSGSKPRWHLASLGVQPR